MAFYCLELISKDENGLKLEKVGPTLIRFLQKLPYLSVISIQIFCTSNTIERFQGSMDYFKDALMHVHLPISLGG